MADWQKSIFVLPHDAGTITSGNERSERPASHLGLHSYPGMIWRTDGASNIWARGDMASAQQVDTVALISSNLQAGTTVRYRLGLDAVTLYDSGALADEIASIEREDGLYHTLHRLDAPLGANWWRIDIGGHSDDFEASSLVLGNAIEPKYFYDGKWERGVEDLRQLEISPHGVAGLTDGQIWRRLVLNLSWTTEAEYEERFALLVKKAGIGSPVYICFDPAKTDYRQGRTYFGYFARSPVATAADKPKHFAQRFEMLSMI